MRQDLTFIILQCGNFEMVLYRCRRTGTFYISDVIAVDKPGYGKHQVGLYLAIYYDVFDRTEQLSKAYRIGEVPKSWLRCYNATSTRGKGAGPMSRESWEELIKLQKVDQCIISPPSIAYTMNRTSKHARANTI